MQGQLAAIFPAFALKYTGKELKILSDWGIDFKSYLNQASEAAGVDLTGFDIDSNDFLDKELENQYLSFALSCAFGDLLKKHGVQNKYTAGFSMGLHAALYHVGCIDLPTGVLLLKDIFNQVRQIMGGATYAMASVIGFSMADLDDYLLKYPEIERVIQNGEYSFVVSGPNKKVNDLLDFLHLEGAIHLSKFKVSCPYHSQKLKLEEIAFEEIVAKYNLCTLSAPVTSFIDQREVNTPNDAGREIVRNVTSPLNFMATIQSLADRGVNEMVEVGPGDSLTKSSKFIEGPFNFSPMAKGKIVSQLCDKAS